MKRRKLFCEISSLCYEISVFKCCMLRRLRDLFSKERFGRKHSAELLPVVVCKHKSLIRRQLGDVDMTLQENKAVNLSLCSAEDFGSVDPCKLLTEQLVSVKKADLRK